MYQHCVLSHSIFELKAQQDLSLSPSNSFHVYIYILLGIVREFLKHSAVSDIMNIWTGYLCSNYLTP